MTGLFVIETSMPYILVMNYITIDGFLYILEGHDQAAVAEEWPHNGDDVDVTVACLWN